MFDRCSIGVRWSSIYCKSIYIYIYAPVSVANPLVIVIHSPSLYNLRTPAHFGTQVHYRTSSLLPRCRPPLEHSHNRSSVGAFAVTGRSSRPARARLAGSHWFGTWVCSIVRRFTGLYYAYMSVHVCDHVCTTQVSVATQPTPLRRRSAEGADLLPSQL